MHKLRITKEFSFEMAHALKHYSGKCENIHGHTYHLSVTVCGPVSNAENCPDDGMVMDFSNLKKIVQEKILDVFDHALVLNEGDTRGDLLCSAHTKLIRTSFQPTSENLIIDFVNRINSSLDSQCTLHSVRLRETATSYAEWYASDNQEATLPIIPAAVSHLSC